MEQEEGDKAAEPEGLSPPVGRSPSPEALSSVGDAVTAAALGGGSEVSSQHMFCLIVSCLLLSKLLTWSAVARISQRVCVSSCSCFPSRFKASCTDSSYRESRLVLFSFRITVVDDYNG